VERLKAYFIKSAREAKLFTNWQQPDSLYEEGVCRFIERILSPQHDFLKSFQPFFRKVLQQAQLLSLTQALVKITAPGVPDIYQGSEGWDTSYVDPDNRRPVDYSIYKKYVMEIKERAQKGSMEVLRYVTEKRTEGLEKLYVTSKALQCRRELAAVFLHGIYIPLYTSAGCGIIAYARQYQKEWVLVIAPTSVPFTNCFLTLPTEAPATWKNEFTGETIEAAGRLSIHTILNNFPVALLTGKIK
jgi:(1->4)-alpha-D-glucan 1-alpha-D-glucosylmutase